MCHDPALEKYIGRLLQCPFPRANWSHVYHKFCHNISLVFGFFGFTQGQGLKPHAVRTCSSYLLCLKPRWIQVTHIEDLG